VSFTLFVLLKMKFPVCKMLANFLCGLNRGRVVHWKNTGQKIVYSDVIANYGF